MFYTVNNNSQMVKNFHRYSKKYLQGLWLKSHSGKEKIRANKTSVMLIVVYYARHCKLLWQQSGFCIGVGVALLLP
jgi:hypothetical protein